MASFGFLLKSWDPPMIWGVSSLLKFKKSGGEQISSWKEIPAKYKLMFESLYKNSGIDHKDIVLKLS